MTTTPTIDCDVNYTSEIPMSSWESLIRRLKSSARGGSLSLLSLSILVDGDGSPMMWTEPACKRFEPRDSARAIKRMMGKSDK